MTNTSPGYSIIIRLHVSPALHASGAVVSTIAKAGAVVTALDMVDPTPGRVTLDISCDARDAEHVNVVRTALDALDGCEVDKVSDRTFLTHIGGKLEVHVKVPMRNRDDLARAYTPGVARVCMAIHNNPGVVRNLTIKRNTVAVVTDGTAVLGLGDIGPMAAMPVMEGKAALFKRFADVDAWPICLDTKDVDEIVRTVQLIAPGFGGINLEDISAPRCFEVEARLRELLDIPVFHDDQHGTAIVVVAALKNALRITGQAIGDLKVVMVGAGAAGHAVAHLMHLSGVRDITLFDSKGAIHKGRTDLDSFKQQLVDWTNPRGLTGSLKEGIVGADLFVGLSAPNLLTGSDIAKMSDRAIVFALANPDPEVDPIAAAQHAMVVATGRSDYPNQINNVLAFPGIFRGLLDAHAHKITDAALLAAAEAIASCVGDDELSAVYIVPSVFHPDIAKRVATAVKHAVGSTHA
jgi:malate dehydrogenase (oxaloacetate-decarboxylating)